MGFSVKSAVSNSVFSERSLQHAREAAYNLIHTPEWYAEQRRKWKAYSREYYESARRRRKERVATEPRFKLLTCLRARLLLALRRGCKRKSAPTMALVGCSLPKLMEWLENQFTEGMTWKNYGKWHVDHKRPCRSFNLSSRKQQKECFHYTNLQPLWALDNIRKAGKWDNS